MIKKLAGCIGQYKLVSILTPLGAAMEVLMETLIPFVTAKLIDQGVTTGDMGAILKYGGYMVLLALLSLFFGALAAKTASVATTGFAANLRKAMYQNIQTFSFSNIDKFSTAGLVTRLTTDTANVQNAYGMVLRIAVRAPLSLICSMIMCFYTSVRLSTIFLVAVVVLGIVLALIVKTAFPRFSAVFEKYDALNASVQENVSAIRVVKAFVREKHETDKFDTASENLYRMFLRAEKVVALNGPVMMLTVYTCMLMISWFGAKYIVGGSMSTGDLTAMFQYAMSILMSLMMLSMIFVMLTLSMASAKRIAEVLDEKADITNPEKPVMQVKDGSIEFTDVRFAYHSGSAEDTLKDIDLKIRSGETIGIIGGTGSGKSSLVNLISRLYDVTGGSVKVGGVDVREYDLDTLRSEVAVVLQKNVLFSGTVLENLRWGNPDATEEECRAACRAACADEFVEHMPDKYNTHIEQGGANVSGGQKQRLCIARALLKNPKVLILDDSTSAVDTATDAKIRRAFKEFIPGTTKLIIAQRVASVKDADRILVLDNGEIAGFGSHAELMAGNEIYREIYETQTQGGGDFDEAKMKDGGEQ